MTDTEKTLAKNAILAFIDDVEIERDENEDQSDLIKGFILGLKDSLRITDGL